MPSNNDATRRELEPSNADIESVAGIGPTIADRLRDQFGSDTDVVSAAYSIPGWIHTHIDGLGEQSVDALHEYAAKVLEIPDDVTPPNQLARARAETKQGKRDGVFKRTTHELYEDTYYPVGIRDDRLGLWYSGFYQGASYGRAISRQTFTRDKVNNVVWGYWHEVDSEWKLLEKRPFEIGGHKTPPVTHPEGADYIGDLIDGSNWDVLTEYGLIVYQRGRNYRVSDYPSTISEIPVYDKWEAIGTQGLSGELVGVTLDRIAIYWSHDHPFDAFGVVKAPNGNLYKIKNDASQFQTNDPGRLWSGYDSPADLVTDFANTERSGMETVRKGRKEGGLWKYVDDCVQVVEEFRPL